MPFAKRVTVRFGLLLLAVGLLCSPIHAGTIGQWVGSASNSIWASSGNFSSIYAAATGGGLSHTVTSGDQISSSVLDNRNFFLIANPTSTPSGFELNLLANWVRAGGILILTVDMYAPNLAATNAVLQTLGIGASGQAIEITSVLQGGAFQTIGGSLQGTDAAVQGIAGRPLSTTGGFTLTGGSFLAQDAFWQNPNLGAYLRTDTFQLGRVYVFGTRIDINPNINSDPFGYNRQFFLNLLGQGGYSGSSDVPEPASLAVTAFALIGFGLWSRRRNGIRR